MSELRILTWISKYSVMHLGFQWARRGGPEKYDRWSSSTVVNQVASECGDTYDMKTRKIHWAWVRRPTKKNHVWIGWELEVKLSNFKAYELYSVIYLDDCLNQDPARRKKGDPLASSSSISDIYADKKVRYHFKFFWEFRVTSSHDDTEKQSYAT